MRARDALHSDTTVRRLHASIKRERRPGGLVTGVAFVVHPPRHREQRRRLAPHRPPLRLPARLHRARQAVLQLQPERREIPRQRAPQVALGEQQVGSRHELQRRLRLDQAQVLLQDKPPAESEESGAGAKLQHVLPLPAPGSRARVGGMYGCTDTAVAGVLSAN